MNYLIAIIIFAQIGIPTPQFPDLPTPTPVASVTPFVMPTIAPDDFLAVAQEKLDELPDDIRRDANGLPLLPSAGNYETLIGNLKWLMSVDAILEIFGIFSFMGFIFAAMLIIAVTMALVWLLVKVIVFIVQFVEWLYNLIPFN